MTPQANTKVRFVRCPKCSSVLPESPEIPVYICAGCNTILQAKHRKPDMNESGFHNQETDENGPKDADRASCFSHSNKDGATSVIEESSPQSTSKSDDSSDSLNMMQPQGKDFSKEAPLSPGWKCSENEDTSPEQKKQMEQDKVYSAADQDTGGCGNLLGDGNSEQHRGRRLSDDFPTSIELTSHEMEDSSRELQPYLQSEKDRYHTDCCTEADEIGCRDEKREYFEGSNFFDDVSSVMADSSPESRVHEQRGNSNHLSQQDSGGSEIASHGPEIPSVRVEAQRVADKELNSRKPESLRAEAILESKESDLIDDTKSPGDEYISADSVISPDNQYLELAQKSLPQDFKDACATNSLTHIPVAESKFELPAKSPDFLKSPTWNYYASNGTVSSYDEMDDQVPPRNSKPPRRKLKHPASITLNRPPKEDECGAQGFPSGKTEMHFLGYNRSHDPTSIDSGAQNQGRKSTILEASHNTVKYQNYEHDDFSEANSYSHYSLSRTRPQKEEYMPSLPRDLLAGHRNDGLPSYYQGRYAGFSSPDTLLYNGPDRLELLKMINELKDELNRTRISNLRFPARFSSEEKQTASFYHQAAPAEGIYTDFLHPSLPAKCSQVKAQPRRLRISRMAYSGEAADYSHRGYCTCLPHGCHYLGSVPLHMTCCNEAPCLAHTGHTFYKGSCSSSSSHQLHTGYHFLQDHESMSDDQRHRETENGRQHERQREPSSKRFIRPAAGGIPLLLCYHCSELLQLPQDFLLYGRRCHRLRCMACRKVMKFSLRSGGHLVPCIPDAVAPPPSMVDDYSDSLNNRELASLSHTKKRLNGKLVSFERSCSIESGRLAGVPPNETLKHGNQNKRILTAGASDLRAPHVGRKNSMETIGLTGKGKLKELPMTSGATLHKLMGYSSPSQVTRLRTSDKQ